MAEQLAFNRDCMEAMREFPDGFFDLAVVDPPYGGGSTHTHTQAGCEAAALTSSTVHGHASAEYLTHTISRPPERSGRWSGEEAAGPLDMAAQSSIGTSLHRLSISRSSRV